MKKLLLVFLIVLSIGCQKDTVRENTYIHGEIVNPLKQYITLFKDNELIDTIFLNENNTFSYRMEKDEEGLYTFKQSPESQTIYITPGDSILFHLNTLAFDETLYFSGNAATKNNFLMELYLLNERNNDLILSYYKIGPKEFSEITDSIRKTRKKMFQKLQGKNDFSEGFTRLAKKGIDYEFYDLRERYAFLITKYSEDGRKVPKDFFNYRKQVDFNDKTLKNHFVYQHFLDDYLKNRSIEHCKDIENDRECYSLNNFHNLRRRILLVDSLFTLDVLKNRFYQRFGRQQIIFSDSKEQIDSTFQLLKQLNYNDEQGLTELTTLAEIQQSYFIGNNISRKKLIDSDFKKITLNEILTKPSITFSWSMYSRKDHQQKHQRISNLRKKYPEINFIGINIDDGEMQPWKKTMAKFRYDQGFEYQNRDTGDKKELYGNYLNKILFINKNGEIVFGDISLDSPNFESYILEFLNQ